MISFLLYLIVVVWLTDAFTFRPTTTTCLSVRESYSTVVLFAGEEDEEDGRLATSSLELGDPVTVVRPLDPSRSVTLKMAFDAQGGVADLSNERSERFTCPESLDMVHRLRRVSDAVLVGRSTVEIDDCTLTVRRVNPLVKSDGKTIQQPVRVILDPSLATQVNKYQIALDGLPTIIVHAAMDGIDVETDAETEPGFFVTTSEDFPNVTFLGLPLDLDGQLSPELMCTILSKEFNIHHIMVEGGPTTARQFLEHKMVDRAILVFAPISFKEPLPSNLSKSSFEEAGLELLGSSMCGVDTIEYYSRPDHPWPTESLSSWP